MYPPFSFFSKPFFNFDIKKARLAQIVRRLQETDILNAFFT